VKVLHVIDKSFLGGGQTVVRNLIAGTRGSAVEPSLACSAGGPLVDEARALGVRVTTLPIDKHFHPGTARRLAALVREDGIDVVHAHGLVAATSCAIARVAFRLRAPILYHQHGFHDHNYDGWAGTARRVAERVICRRVDRVIAVSHADYERLAEDGYVSPMALRLVHYGIPVPTAAAAEVARAREESGVGEGDEVIGFVGRMHPQKGVDVLLRAAAMVRERNRCAVLVAVGTGELEREMHRLAAELGLGSAVRWIGGRAAAPFLPLFSVSVLASRWEGLPFTLLEAMASAKAIVTTDVPGCLEAVSADEAEIVPREDPRAMADAILRLLGDAERAQRLASAARRRFESQFTLKSMLRHVEEIYAEVGAAVPAEEISRVIPKAVR
jgi:glycosyltransferase involved in cell wall biosynthesis